MGIKHRADSGFRKFSALIYVRFGRTVKSCEMPYVSALNSEWLFETFKAFTKGDLTIQSLKIFKDSKNRRNVLIKYWDFESESWVESLLADVTELHKS